MTALRTLLMGICAAVVFIEMFSHDFFPTEWNLALLIVAVASLGGVWAITYATRNEVGP